MLPYIAYMDSMGYQRVGGKDETSHLGLSSVQSSTLGPLGVARSCGRGGGIQLAFAELGVGCDTGGARKHVV